MWESHGYSSVRQLVIVCHCLGSREWSMLIFRSRSLFTHSGTPAHEIKPLLRWVFTPQHTLENPSHAYPEVCLLGESTYSQIDSQYSYHDILSYFWMLILIWWKIDTPLRRVRKQMCLCVCRWLIKSSLRSRLGSYCWTIIHVSAIVLFWYIP